MSWNNGETNSSGSSQFNKFPAIHFSIDRISLAFNRRGMHRRFDVFFHIAIFSLIAGIEFTELSALPVALCEALFIKYLRHKDMGPKQILKTDRLLVKHEVIKIIAMSNKYFL